MDISAFTLENRLRLKSIKLAGFKSFVDPTTVYFPNNLVGVVGPNGCGKSNIIDAVRWVMGESSAKNLRAEAGTDVIFNGSTERKPVSQASVELIFDNPNGAIGGEYAQYSEISIRRLITREGQSTYFLNNTRCRRRDITDIFLGTGLGPRSYSIIEQGMISKLVEARPEDLRVYLEEAAGISKYKERRRETENRIRHTRENLTRLEDIRLELDKQLERLKRQAEVAEKYKAYQLEENRLRLQGLLKRWQTLTQEKNTIESKGQGNVLLLEEAITIQNRLSCDLDTQEIAQHKAMEAWQNAQTAYYQHSNQVNQIEQRLERQKERANQIGKELESLLLQSQNFEETRAQDEAKIQILAEKEASGLPELVCLEAQYTDVEIALESAQFALETWQSSWETFIQTHNQTTQAAQVEQTKIQYLEQQLSQYQQRIGRLQEEQNRLKGMETEQESLCLEERIERLEEQIEKAQDQLTANQDNLRIGLNKEKEYFQSIKRVQTVLSQLEGELTSLAILQSAEWQTEGKKTWLAQSPWAENLPLLETIRVKGGWERAAELVLSSHLTGLCLDDLSPSVLNPNFKGEGSLFFWGRALPVIKSTARLSLPLLTEYIEADYALPALLPLIYAVPNLEMAQRYQTQLIRGESIITPEGQWLGPDWLAVLGQGSDEGEGPLARQHKMATLVQERALVTAELAELEEGAIRIRDHIESYQIEQSKHQSQLNEYRDQLGQKQAHLTLKRGQIEQGQERWRKIVYEIEELTEQQKQDEQALTNTRLIWEGHLNLLHIQNETKQDLQKEKELCRQALEAIRLQYRQLQGEKRHCELNLQQISTEKREKETSLLRLTQQIRLIDEKIQSLKEEKISILAPLDEFEMALEQGLEQLYEIEISMQDKKRVLEELDHSMREFQSQKQGIDQRVNEIKTAIDSYRLSLEGLLVRIQYTEEQLALFEWDLLKIQAAPSVEVLEQTIEEGLNLLQGKIQRLGPINLAAIEEYASESERATYLKTQCQDLEDALTTLEAAIQKIDKETRQTFKETVDRVNEGFQNLFPKIFGGGSAYLSLTSEDLLEAGVSVMARPPGKKNSTIHLLSGGEKALTAIALVFSIFQLNPAPFCMLDEVDAPLDDANVGRYCQLIQDMSKTVQFIFISHNKLAISMGECLTGVTMREPGVSRLVSVNIQEAIALAEI